MEEKATPIASIFDGLNIKHIAEIVQMIPGIDNSPDIKCGTRVVQESSDGRFVTGVWRCEPCNWGPMTMGGRGEFFQVLEGSMIIKEDGKDPVEALPGMTVFTPPGWSGQWMVPSRLLKAFVSFRVD